MAGSRPASLYIYQVPGAVLTDWAAACATPAVSCLDARCACFTEYLLTIDSRFAPGMGAFSFPGIRE